MNDFKNETKARHAQMFELLRQPGPAAQSDAVAKRYLDDVTSHQIKDSCLTSLRPVSKETKARKWAAPWISPLTVLKLRKTKPHSGQQ